MATLDRWLAFLETPKTISLPRASLIGRDNAPALVLGTGRINMPTSNEFTFNLTGAPQDIRYALTQLNEINQSPYDGLARPRLVGTSEEGIEWAGGYVIPEVDEDAGVWSFRGEIDALFTDDKSDSVSKLPSTELVFLLPAGLTSSTMSRFVRTQASVTPSSSEYRLEVLGSEILFRYDQSRHALFVTAHHSQKLPPTYTENWLGEPLQIMFGQLLFPRLVARNFDDGRAMIAVRRLHGRVRTAGWAALWHDETAKSAGEFWSIYAQLLQLIALASGFEPHKLTRIYQEIVQASRGSRWVWALTFASGIEALAKMLRPNTTASEQERKDVKSLVDYIDKGPGEPHLKKIALNSLHRTLEMTTIRILRDLQSAGVIDTKQLSAWEAIRNPVMHGSLISPYSSKEEDEQLLAMASMTHALTRELVRRQSLAVQA